MARIIFFGTPEFSVPSLEALLESEHDVVAVVCQADRPKGRGKKMQFPPVKECALAAGVEVLQPLTLKKGTEEGEEFWRKYEAMDLDLGVVTAYGRILSNRILRFPRRGFVNVHASLLPRWRGAAPIQRAIAAGDDETGVCLMDMVYALDAGDVYATAKCDIHSDDTGDALTERLAQVGKETLAVHLQEILDEKLPKVPQLEEGICYADMLHKSEAKLDWRQSAQQVHDHCRAMFSWPGTTTIFDEQPLKLFASRVCDDVNKGNAQSGEVLFAQDELVVACGDGVVAFADLQVPGKKRMAVKDAIRGRPIEKGTLLGDVQSTS